MDRNNEIQTAIYERLTADSDIMAIVTGIYDDVPQGTDRPYIVIGDSTFTDDSTQTYTAMDNTLNIHTWSVYSGKKQLKTIMQLIYNSLNRQTLTLSAGTNWELLFDYGDDFVDPDGETRHGVQRFKIKTVG